MILLEFDNPSLLYISYRHRVLAGAGRALIEAIPHEVPDHESVPDSSRWHGSRACSCCFLFSHGQRAGLLLKVSLDTSPLVGNAAGPFALDFTLIGGDGGAGNMTVTITNFDLGAVQPPSTPTLIGGASGDLISGVTLTDGDFFNDFSAGVAPGPGLRSPSR